MGSKKILELCVGPSLAPLEMAYNKFGIDVTGNDIEDRWQRFYPKGKWIIGDALGIDLKPFDTIIFAPPLSKGCTGTQNDSLQIEQINPSYCSFIDKVLKDGYDGLVVLVLPARSLSTKWDRKQYYALLSFLERNNFIVDISILTSGKRNIRKYVDLYVRRNPLV